MSRRKTPELPPAKPEVIIQRSMEEVMHESMIPYSEHVIMERALPRVEDGLKPVQRRILYTMHELGNTPDKPHRKCARIVGDCLGKYHPHGDSSVYDALTRMAQPFAMRVPLVDGHGNFGSIDGDSPAAMRYTEARMTEQALLMLRDIDKDTVGFHLNFDDSLKEPDLLPGRFPNLLVNGANGIAVGLATNIPPHNMGEVIEGTIALIDKPKITTRELMAYIKAPDFPTGGLLAADDELIQAYETGRGRIQVRAKVHVENGAAGRRLIVIDEIPYQINKASMLEKILHLSEEKKQFFGGIYDIRDESDRTGMRAVIELKRDVDPETMLNALYKYSDLQTTFGVNMVAIADGKPMQLGLKAILNYYLQHQKSVITRRTRYDLQQAEARAHILEGLIIAVDNLDEVIRLIRSSKTPKEARGRLVEAFSLTEIQAQAILDMRLQRLTNLEVLALRQEYAELEKKIAEYKAILASERKLMGVIKKELKEIGAAYADARRTQIVNAFDEIVIQEQKPEAEDVVVLMSQAGFLKRMTPRNYDRMRASDEDLEPPKAVLRVTTQTRLLFFTDTGNSFTLGADQIPEGRPKDRGIAPGGLLAGLEHEEQVVAVLPVQEGDDTFLFVTKGGVVKRTGCGEYIVRKGKVPAIRLKDGDALIAVMSCGAHRSLMLLTRAGMALSFAVDEISVTGRTTAGVKGISLSDKDEVIRAFLHDSEGELVLITDLGYIKRCLLIDFDRRARATAGTRCFAMPKNAGNGTCLADAAMVTDPFDFRVVQKSGAFTKMNTEEVAIETRSGKGSACVVVVMDDVVTALQPYIG